MGTDQDLSLAESEFEGLFARAQAACVQSPFTNDHEPAFVLLLDYIKTHPSCHDAAERKFVDGVVAHSLCYELIAFCMHTLRLPRVADAARQQLNPSNPRSWGPLSSILSSFDDDWDDADLYDYYQRQQASLP